MPTGIFQFKNISNNKKSSINSNNLELYSNNNILYFKNEEIGTEDSNPGFCTLAPFVLNLVSNVYNEMYLAYQNLNVKNSFFIINEQINLTHLNLFQSNETSTTFSIQFFNDNNQIGGDIIISLNEKSIKYLLSEEIILEKNAKLILKIKEISENINNKEVLILGEGYYPSIKNFTLSNNEVYYNKGNIGIGTNNPLSLLHIKNGDFKIENNLNYININNNINTKNNIKINNKLGINKNINFYNKKIINEKKLFKIPNLISDYYIFISDDYKISKKGQTLWNGNFSSSESYCGSCYLKFKILNNYTSTFIGLSKKPNYIINENNDFQHIDFAWYIDTINVSIRENGRSVLFITNNLSIPEDSESNIHNVEDIYEIIYENSKINYYRNSKLIRSTLHLLKSSSGVYIDNNSVVSKISSTTAWDEHVFTTLGYTKSCYVKFRFLSNNKIYQVGLNTDPETNLHMNSIDYSFQADGGTNTLFIYENGTQQQTIGSINANDTLEIKYENTTISYIRNGTTVRTVTVSSGLKFYLDSSILSSGNNLFQILCFKNTNLANDGVINNGENLNLYLAGSLYYVNDNTAQILQFSKTYLDNELGIDNSIEEKNINFNGQFNISDYSFNDIIDVPKLITSNYMVVDNKFIISRDMPGMGGNDSTWDQQVYTNVSFTNRCYLKFRTLTDCKEYTLGLNSDPTTNASYTSLDYSLNIHPTGIYIWEDNNGFGKYSDYTINDVFEIIHENSKINYYHNGSLIRSTFDWLKMSNNISVNDELIVSRLSNKIDGLDTTQSQTWNSHLYSSIGYTNSCYLKFQFLRVGETNIMLGLSDNPTESVNFDTIEYSFHVNSTNFYIYESVNEIFNFGAHNNNNNSIYEIVYDNSQLTYYIDGNIKYTRYVAPNTTLYLDSSIVNNVQNQFQILEFCEAPKNGFSMLSNNWLTSTTNITFDSNYNVQKISGGNSWHALLNSINYFEGSCMLKFYIHNTANHYMIGITTLPKIEGNYGYFIDFCFYIDQGTLRIYERAVHIGDFGTVSPGDYLTIKYENKSVYYIKYDYNTSSNHVYRITNKFNNGSSLSDNENFYLQTSIHNTASGVNLFRYLIWSKSVTPVSDNIYPNNNTDEIVYKSIKKKDISFYLDSAFLNRGGNQVQILQFTDYYDKNKLGKNSIIINKVDSPIIKNNNFTIEFWAKLNKELVPPLYHSSGIKINNNMISKTNTTTGWNEHVYTMTSYKNQCYLRFKIINYTVSPNHFFIGFNSDPETDVSYTSIDFCWYCDSGVGHVFENGVHQLGGQTGTFLNGSTTTNAHIPGTIKPGDIFEIIYDKSHVSYYYNKKRYRYMHGTSVENKTFYLDCSFHNSYNNIVEIQEFSDIIPYTIYTLGDIIPYDNSWFVADSNSSITYNNIVNKLNNDGAWNSHVYSKIGYDSKCYLKFKALIQNGLTMVGLNSDPQTNGDYQTIDWCIYLRNNGSIAVYEGGTYRSDYNYYHWGDIFEIIYDGSTIKYYHNYKLIRRVFYTLPSDGRLLYFDSSLHDAKYNLFQIIEFSDKIRETNNINIQINYNDLIFTIQKNSVEYYINCFLDNINKSEWNHYAITFDNSNTLTIFNAVKFYINGKIKDNKQRDINFYKFFNNIDGALFETGLKDSTKEIIDIIADGKSCIGENFNGKMKNFSVSDNIKTQNEIFDSININYNLSNFISQEPNDDNNLVLNIQSTNNEELNNNGITFYGGINNDSFTFIGSSSYIELPANIAPQLAGSDFTIEFWAKVPQVIGAERFYIYAQGDYFVENNNIQIYVGYNPTRLWFNFSRFNDQLDLTLTNEHFNNLKHYAFVYDKSKTNNQDTIKLYIDGIQQTLNFASGAIMNDGTTASGPVYLGGGWSHSTNVSNGEILELKHIRVYNNIQYSNNFVVDNSLFIVNNKNYVTTLDNNLKLYIPMNSIDINIYTSNSTKSLITFKDSSLYNHTIYGFGNAEYKTNIKINNLSSIYFDGTGDYLRIPNSSYYDFGFNNFTIEFWFYTTHNSVTQTLLTNATSPWDSQSTWWIGYNTLRQLSFAPKKPDNSVVNLFANSVLSINRWYHLAFVRNGNLLLIFIDGILDKTHSLNYAILDSTNDLYIGVHGSTLNVYFSGYLDNIRIVNGEALYTENFDIYNFNGSKSNDSYIFDGTDDFLLIPQNIAPKLCGSDFTIEFWAKINDNTSLNIIYSQGTDTAGNNISVYIVNNTVVLDFYTFGSNATINDDSLWHHYAIIYNMSLNTNHNNATTFYIDGVLTSNNTNSYSSLSIPNASGRVLVGRDTGSYRLNGELKHLRVYDKVRTKNEIQSSILSNTITNDLSSQFNFNTTIDSFIFNGTSDYIEISADKSPQLAGSDFTIEFWAKIDNTAVSQIYLQSSVGWNNSGSHGNFLGIIYRNTDNLIHLDFYGKSVGWDISIYTNNWNYYAFVYDKSQTDNLESAKLYINGILINAYNNFGSMNSGTNASGSIRIGLNYNGTVFMKGELKLLRVYNNIKTTEEINLSIQKNYNLCLSTHNENILNSNNIVLDLKSYNSGYIKQYQKTSETINYYNLDSNSYFYDTNNKLNGLSFNGTNQYIEIPETIVPKIFNANITIEFWAYIDSSHDGGYEHIYRFGNSSGNSGVGDINFGIYNLNGSQSWTFYIQFASSINSNKTRYLSMGNNAPSLNQYLDSWHHYAIVRNHYDDTPSGNLKLYINGDYQTLNYIDNGAGTSNNWSLSGPGIIGSNDGSSYFKGKLKNFRLWNCLRTQSQINSFKDIYIPTLIENLLLNIPMNNLIIYAYKYSITEKPNTITTTNSIIGDNLPTFYSDYTSFDGTNDYFEIPENIAPQLAMSDFTIEFWAKVNATSGYPPIFSQGIYESHKMLTIQFNINNPDNTFNNKLHLNFAFGRADIDISTLVNNSTIHNWNHFAVVFDSSGFNNMGSVMFYLNGVLGTTEYWNGQNTHLGGMKGQTTASGVIRLGNYFHDNSYFHGELKELRVWNDIRTQSEIIQAINNNEPNLSDYSTTLNDNLNLYIPMNKSDKNIYNNNNNFKDNSSKNNQIIIYGKPIYSNYTYKHNLTTGSIYFDGSSDYLEIQNSSDFNLGSNDFTIEVWINLSSYSGWATIVSKATLDGAYPSSYTLTHNGTNKKIYFWYSTTGTNWDSNIASSTELSLNTWYHIALTRENDILRIFINGIIDSEKILASNYYIFESNNNLNIGIETSNYYFNGYLENLKIINGSALYIENFNLYNFGGKITNEYFDFKTTRELDLSYTKNIYMTNDYRIGKVGGVNDTWVNYENLFSNTANTGYCCLKFQVIKNSSIFGDRSIRAMIGLTKNPNTIYNKSESFQNIDYAIYVYDWDGSLDFQIYESGTFISSFGTSYWKLYDMFSIIYNYGTVYYYHNNTEIKTSTTTSSNETFYLQFVHHKNNNGIFKINEFTGPTHNIQIPSNIAPQLGNGGDSRFTIEFWANIEHTTLYREIYSQGDTDSYHNYLTVSYGNGSSKNFMKLDFHGTFKQWNISNYYGIWTHYSIIYNNTYYASDDARNYAILYINGELISGEIPSSNISSITLGTNASGSIFIGRNSNSTGNYNFNGQLKLLRVYNRVKTQSEIQNAIIYPEIKKIENYNFVSTNNGTSGAPKALISDTNVISRIITNDTWDVHVFSTQGYNKCCYLKFTPLKLHHGMYGFNINPQQDRNYTSIDYCWYVRTASTTAIYENGVYISDFNSYNINDVFEILYDSKSVKYFHNNNLIREVFYTLNSDEKFYFDSSVHDLGDDLVQILEFTDKPSKLNYKPNINDYNSDLYNNLLLYIPMNSNDTNIYNLNYNININNYSNILSPDLKLYIPMQNHNKNIYSLDINISPNIANYSIILDNNTILYVPMNNVDNKIYCNKAIETNTINNTKKNEISTNLIKSNILLSTNNITVNNNLYWNNKELTGIYNISNDEFIINNESDKIITYKISKIFGGSQHNGNIYSNIYYNNSCYLKFKLLRNDKRFMIGLNDIPQSMENNYYLNINYTFYIPNDGRGIIIFEKGRNQGEFNNFNSNDEFEIIYENNCINYLHNNQLIKTTSTSVLSTSSTVSYDNEYKVSKVSGDNIWGNASLWSNIGYVNSCYLKFKILLTNNYYTVGLNSNPLNHFYPDFYSYSDHYQKTSIDYKWYINADVSPTIEIYVENGIDNEREVYSSSEIRNTNTTEANDICEIIYKNSTIKFYFNYELKYTVNHTWIARKNMQITEDFLVSKDTGGTDWNAHLYSKMGFNNSCYLKFRAVYHNNYYAVGISTSTRQQNVSDYAYGTRNGMYAWYLKADNSIEIFHNGNMFINYPSTNWSGDEIFEILYENSTIKFYRNNNPIPINTVSVDSNLTFYLDSSMYMQQSNTWQLLQFSETKNEIFDSSKYDNQKYYLDSSINQLQSNIFQILQFGSEKKEDNIIENNQRFYLDSNFIDEGDNIVEILAFTQNKLITPYYPLKYTAESKFNGNILIDYYNFNGISDYFEIPPYNAPQLAGSNFTIEFWAKLNTLSIDGLLNYRSATIIEQGNYTDNEWLFLYMYRNSTGTTGISLDIYGSTYGDINIDNYYHKMTHYAISYNYITGNYNWYINGNNVLSGTNTNKTSSSGSILIGKNKFATTNRNNLYGNEIFDGKLKKLKIWNTIRTNSEIKTSLGDIINNNNYIGNNNIKFDGTIIDDSFYFNNNTLNLNKDIIYNPSEFYRDYDSVHNGDHIPSLLDNNEGIHGAWSTQSINPPNNWMQISINNLTNIVGVITQGRFHYDQWVTKFKVQYSSDNINFNYVDNEKIYNGNCDRNTKVYNYFKTHINAKIIRIIPTEYSGFISMRAALIIHNNINLVPELLNKDFTIEFWANIQTDDDNKYLLLQYGLSNTTNNTLFLNIKYNNLGLEYYDSSNNKRYVSIDISNFINKWNHYAISFNNNDGNIQFYINTNLQDYTYNQGLTTTKITALNNIIIGNNRFINDKTNTILEIKTGKHNSIEFIDITGKNNIVSIGNSFDTTNYTKHDTDNILYADSSIYFNESYLEIIEDTANSFDIGTSSFTIEFWLKMTGHSVGNGSNWNCFFEFGHHNSGGCGGIGFWFHGSPHWFANLHCGTSNGSGIYKSYNSSELPWGQSVSWNKFYHIAIVRCSEASDKTINLYVDGNLLTPYTSVGITSLCDVQLSPREFRIGQFTHSDYGLWSGYMEHFRFVKEALYTQNFDPKLNVPIQEFNTYSGYLKKLKIWNEIRTTEDINISYYNTDTYLNTLSSIYKDKLLLYIPMNTQELYYNNLTNSSNDSFTFNGTNDYFEIPQNITPQLANSDFTIDFWAKIINTTDGTIFKQGNLSDHELIQIRVSSNSIILNFSSGEVTFDITSTTLNNWNHYAIVYDSTGFNNMGSAICYVNGNQKTATYWNGGNTHLQGMKGQTSAFGLISIGRFNASISQYFNGELKHLRVYNKIVYNNNFNVNNLLFIVNQTNYSTVLTDNILLYIPMNNYDRKIYFKDNIINKNYKLNNTINLDNINIGNFNSEILDYYNFDGLNDYIDIPSHIAPQLANSYFTIQFWAKLAQLPNNDDAGPIYSQGTNSPFNRLNIVYDGGTANNLYLNFHDNWIRWNIASYLNTWTHYAIVYNNNAKLYVNGILVDIDNTYGTITNGTTAMGVVEIGRNSEDNFYLNGELKHLRVYDKIKSILEIQNSITTIQNINENMFLNNSFYDFMVLYIKSEFQDMYYWNTDITDSSSYNQTINLYDGDGNGGGVSISHYYPLINSSHIYIHGRIYATYNQNLNFIHNNFTIEFWVYLRTHSAYGTYFTNGSNSMVGASYYIYTGNTSSNSKIYIKFSDNGSWSGISTFTNNINVILGEKDTNLGFISKTDLDSEEWYHIAITRQNCNFKVFLNGTIDGEFVLSKNYNIYNSTNDISIGAQNDNGNRLQARINEIKIFKGKALYTNNFYIYPPHHTYKIDNYIFNGSKDYLEISQNIAPQLAGSDFTIEFWAKFHDLSDEDKRNVIFAQGTSSTQNMINILAFTFNSQTRLQFNTYNFAVGTQLLININSWNHYAFTFDSSENTLNNALKIYINGIISSNINDSNNINNTNSSTITASGNIFIGADKANITGTYGWSYLNGELKHLRVYNKVKTQTEIQQSIDITTLKTKYLELYIPFKSSNEVLNIQSNTIIDNSQDFTDISSSNHTIVSYGNTKHSIVNSFANSNRFKSAIYFDGLGDYLKVGNIGDADFNFGSMDFTIEFWINKSSHTTSWQVVIGAGRTGGTNSSFIIEYEDQTGKIGVIFSNNNSWHKIYRGLTNMNLNQWYHVAICRFNTNLLIFINGNIDSIHYMPLNFYINKTNNFSLKIGVIHTNNSDENPSNALFNGYLNNIRIIKGEALYREEFLIYDVNINIDSFLFDGSTQYLTIPENKAPQLSGSNFTIEFWVKINSFTGDWTSIYRQGSEGDHDHLAVLIDINYIYLNFSSGRADFDISSLTLTNWNHFAIVFDSTGFSNMGSANCYFNAVLHTPIYWDNGNGLLGMKGQTSASGNVIIGLNLGNNTYFDGELKLLRVYNKIKTQIEIQNAILNSNPRISNYSPSEVNDSNNLLLYIPMNSNDTSIYTPCYKPNNIDYSTTLTENLQLYIPMNNTNNNSDHNIYATILAQNITDYSNDYTITTDDNLQLYLPMNNTNSTIYSPKLTLYDHIITNDNSTLSTITTNPINNLLTYIPMNSLDNNIYSQYNEITNNVLINSYLNDIENNFYYKNLQLYLPMNNSDNNLYTKSLIKTEIDGYKQSQAVGFSANIQNFISSNYTQYIYYHIINDINYDNNLYGIKNTSVSSIELNYNLFLNYNFTRSLNNYGSIENNNITYYGHFLDDNNISTSGITINNNNYISVDVGTMINSFSISLWIYVNDPSKHGKIFTFNHNDTWTSLMLQLTTNQLYFGYYGHGHYSTTTPGSYNVNEWTHVVCILEGNNTTSTTKLYINNILVDTTNWNASILSESLNSLTISNLSSWWGGDLDLELDSFSLVNGILNTNDISYLYNSGIRNILVSSIWTKNWCYPNSSIFQNGKFICPINGLYKVYANIRFDNVSQFIRIIVSINKNTSYVKQLHNTQGAINSDYETINISGTIQLFKNDIVTIVFQVSNTLTFKISEESSFSIILINTN